MSVVDLSRRITTEFKKYNEYKELNNPGFVSLLSGLRKP